MDEVTAIKECKKLWLEIVESAMTKEEFLNSTSGRKWTNKRYSFDCPLCAISYSHGVDLRCPTCPLVKQYGKGCYELGYVDDYMPSPKWLKAIGNLEVQDA